MRVNFTALTRPKRASKVLADAARIRLSAAHDIMAQMCGYKDWHELSTVTEAASFPPSLLDDELPEAQLQERHARMLEVLTESLDLSTPQAIRLLAACSPLARAPKLPEDGSSIVGQTLFMPPLGAYFCPDVEDVANFLYDVRRLTLRFSSPRGAALHHLASAVEVQFLNGTSLTLDGVYFWQFLTTAPPELADKKGRYLETTPFSRGTAETLMTRLRYAYNRCFRVDGEVRVLEDPPEVATIDISAGVITRVEFPRLSDRSWNACLPELEQVARESIPELVGLVHEVVAKAKAEGYQAFSYTPVAGGIRPTYTPRAWEAFEYIKLPEVLAAYSAESKFSGGCGGMKKYRDILEERLQPYLAQLTQKFCKKLAEAGKLKTVARELGTTAVSSQNVAKAWLETTDKSLFSLRFTDLLEKEVSSRTAGELLLTDPPALPSLAVKKVSLRATPPALGARSSTSFRLEDPRSFDGPASLQGLDDLNEGMDLLRDLDVGFLVNNAVNARIEANDFDSLARFMEAAEDYDDYRLRENSVAIGIDSVREPHWSNRRKVLFGLNVCLHAVTPTGQSGPLRAISTEDLVSALFENSEGADVFGEALSYSHAPYLVDPEDVFSLSLDKRRSLIELIDSGADALPVRRCDFPEKLGAYPESRMLLFVIDTEDFTDSVMRRYPENLVEPKLRRLIGAPSSQVRVLSSGPYFLLDALRAARDLHNVAALWTFVQQNNDTSLLFETKVTTHKISGTNVELRFRTGTETCIWKLPPSMSWAKALEPIAGLLAGHPSRYLRALFGA